MRVRAGMGAMALVLTLSACSAGSAEGVATSGPGASVTSVPTPMSTSGDPVTATPRPVATTTPPVPPKTSTTSAPTSSQASRVCSSDRASYPVLMPGAKGDAVFTLQCALNAGFGTNLTTDGVYGQQTLAEIKKIEAGFEGAPPISGRIDAGMWVLVLSAGPDRSLAQGSSGDDVRRVQRAMTAAGFTTRIDGVFGAETTSSVKKYQHAMGLMANGVVGKETWFILKQGGAPRR